jgi:hypothetical protein
VVERGKGCHVAKGLVGTRRKMSEKGETGFVVVDGSSRHFTHRSRSALEQGACRRSNPPGSDGGTSDGR